MVKKTSILIFSLSVLCSLVCCDNQDNPDKIILEINTEEFASRHLCDFALLRERYIDSLRIENVFERESDSILIFLTIGIYQSEIVADSTVNEYVSYISIHMAEGSHQGVSIGDKFWWYPSDADSNGLTNIVFLRRNAFIAISCSIGYENLRALAKSIDNDVLNEASYIKFRI